MGRRIITEEFQTTPDKRVDTYFDKVIKYIPADIVAGWTTLIGLVDPVKGGADTSTLSTSTLVWFWFLFAIFVSLTAGWTWKQTQVKNKPPARTQILVSMGSFIVWVFALGGPFKYLNFYTSQAGAVLLIVYTLMVGLVDPPRSENRSTSAQQ